MQAILMAGGKGTRLRPFTNILPKPLVPIGEMSIMELVLRQLRALGFKSIIVTVGYKAELIMAVIGDGHRFGLNVHYHLEEKPLGTIGPLASISDRLEDDFLVMNGDICTNLNFRTLYESHVDSSALATVGTYLRREKIELGVLKVDDTRKIVSFQEKPTYDFMVSMGVNAFHRSIVDLIPADEFFGFDDLMHKLIESGGDVRSYPFDGKWHDIGRPDDYQRVLEEFEAESAVYLPELRDQA